MSIPLLGRELSLDAFVGAAEDTRLSAFLADPHAVDPELHVLRIEVRRLVERALLALDSRERHIIRRRYGLADGEAQTLEEVGKGLRLSRERVRQIESQAKVKLHNRLRAQWAYMT